MERQLADFTDGLDQSYEWVYVDGDLEASKAKGEQKRASQVLQYYR